MSYEYQITSDSNDTKEIYMKIKLLLENSTEYQCVSSNTCYTSFNHKITDSNWGTDIDLSIHNEMVFLEIHAGNAKKLVRFIESSFSDIHLNIEEL